jgi:lipoprotein-anchoring transpeptidase ErfK/SrfK
VVFVAVYAHLIDGAMLKRMAAGPPSAAASAAPLPTGTRLAALPAGDGGAPVLEGNAATDREGVPAGEPRNDLQRRIAKLQKGMENAIAGRSQGDLIYVSLPDLARIVNGDWRWEEGQRAGVLITDEGLVAFTTDSAQVLVNQEPRDLVQPVRLMAGLPHAPLKTAADLYDAALRENKETGLTTVAMGGESFPIVVPERLFRIEISRSERWLKVTYAGKLAKEYPICSGAGNNTPVGHFHIQNKAEWPSWRAYWGEYMPGGSARNPLGARWLGTTARGRATGWPIGIHGTNQPSSIGQRISGGCIRTYNQTAIELYETIPIGTPVWIHE